VGGFLLLPNWPTERLRAAAAALVIVMIGGAAGCASRADSGGADQPGPDPYATVQPTGEVVTVHVSPSTALSVRIPGIGRISGPSGAFSRAGTITIRGQRAAFAARTGLRPAGPGIGVWFHGTALRKPLSLTFDVGARPGPQAVPVIVHHADNGSWDVRAASLVAGHLTVATSSFSVNIPSWANPLHWWDSLASMIASGVGGRTAPLTCSGAPGWFHLSGVSSDLVHVCAKTNHASGQEVAEVQIKSNRGVSLEVTVPGSPAYVWVHGQSWTWRQETARGLGFDPNRTVILPAGETMTVGYPRLHTPAPFSFFVSGATAKAATDTAIRDMIDFAAGQPDPILLGYSEVKCATGLGVGGTGITAGVASFRQFLTCWTGQLAGGLLSDEQTALNVASRFGGEDVATLVRHAKSVHALGWLVSLWPLFQLGIGNDIDKIHERLSGGQSALVSYHMDPAPSPGGSSGGGQPGTGGGTPGGGGHSGSPTVSLSRGPSAPQGYRYAIRLSGFPASTSVSVTCYDSISTGGFYIFRLGTDAAGQAFTQSQCYSGAGSDHWVVAGGHESNHVQWSSAAPPPPPPPPPTHSETTGGVTHTWTNYTNAGGTAGPAIPSHSTVQVTCKVTGFKVADGNTWWYRIASPGWSNHYYASADAFYNNGHTSGSLSGTPWVDNAVPNC